MADQPLQPFAPPTAFLSHLPGGLSAGLLVEWALYAVFFFWAVYTLVAIYHWLKYSHGAILAYPAIGLHVLVSVCLMAYALSGTILFNPLA